MGTIYHASQTWKSQVKNESSMKSSVAFCLGYAKGGSHKSRTFVAFRLEKSIVSTLTSKMILIDLNKTLDYLTQFLLSFESGLFFGIFNFGIWFVNIFFVLNCNRQYCSKMWNEFILFILEFDILLSFWILTSDWISIIHFLSILHFWGNNNEYN